DVAATAAVSSAPQDLTVGKQLIIRGTEVSFYIPPTGIEVVRDGETYAREALTLERLEYSILVDENGKKRYEVGPQVVFPLPTERFVEARDDGGARTKKFRAVELNEIQGLHIKVIADYTEAGVVHRAGDELFITGKDTAIYFPREEHSAIKYDGKAKHFATAIPAGEARYVMDRLTGAIRTVRGPAMLLPDPRHEVIVRRVLTDRECALWYPGNAEALSYNQSLRQLIHNVPTTRQGVLSEGDVERGGKRVAKPAAGMVMESSRVSGDQALVADEFSRASTYSQPRMALLDNKYQGAPQLAVWTGYAVLVTAKTGRRRVEVGPATVLLDYDETIEAFALSTGKPKTTDKLLETPFLRVENNQVTDIVEVETFDHVYVQLRMSYRVNFGGDPLKWFAVENYVKYLCDHVRSTLKGAIRKLTVEAFYATSTDQIRQLIAGMEFPANGMRIQDVDVLQVTLKDDKIRALLEAAQHDVVKSNIDVSNLNRELTVTKQREAIQRETAEVKALTKMRNDDLARELATSELATALARMANTLRETDERKKLVEAEQSIESFKLTQRIERVKRERDQELVFFSREQEKRIELLRAEAETAVLRFQAASGNFSEALMQLSRHETLVKVAEAWGVQRVVEGESLGDTLSRLFHNTPLKPLVDKLTLTNGNGD
ncbi:MAG: hypothetical protein ACKV2T_37480, partial [Kofleriaceae bacterium]